MILEKQTEAIIQQEGESQDSIGMSLDLDSAQILMQMLSKNLYSDSVGSTIRECVSNALDSHRRAGIDKPIIVSFRQNSHDNYEFSVEDFGIGLDAGDVKNIISKYGKSTKRNSTTELGMMGLGFKAPLAYCSSFYFICRKDGIERKYMMYEGEETNTIDLLHECATKECNGVKVIVPVQYYDRTEFNTKIKEQLAYFENVYFDVEGFDNSFSITRAEHFQYSPINNDGNLHICLDNVYYPIDFGKLGIDILRFPVGLRFSLTDGLFPTPNRESIRYTKEAKETILAKIGIIADYFVEKYNECVKETDNFTQILDYYSTSTRYINLFNKSLEISSLSILSSLKLVKPTMKGVKVLDLYKVCSMKDYILQEHEVKFRIESNRIKECKNSWGKSVNINDVKENTHFIYSDKISGVMKDYIKHTYPSHGWSEKRHLCKKMKSYTLGSAKDSLGTKYSNFTTYYDILGLRTVTRDKWRAAIQEYQMITKSVLSEFINLDNLVIPQSFIDGRKKVKVGAVSSGLGVRKIKLKGEFVGKELTLLERDVYGKYSKQVSTTYKFETAEKTPALIVYGNSESGELMDKLFSIFNDKEKSIRFVVFSERELKNFNQLNFHNWIPIETFMKGKTKPFKRIITSALINQLMQSNRWTFERAHYMEKVSMDIKNKLLQLYEYKKKHYKGGKDEVLDAMMEIAQANNLFDMEIYSTYIEVKTILEKFPFVNTLFGKFSYSNNDDMIAILVDMFKYHKKRIDWNNYNIKLNLDDVVIQEDSLTEEDVDELEELCID